jgi:pimeloyl-ACP methyl ester carboxylesterase
VQTIQKHELLIDGPKGRKISLDISVPKSLDPTPILILCHGFKGFKDWGHFNWVSEQVASQGIAFLKFNFSLNGVSKDNLNDISDLDAFASNTYSNELEDLGAVLDYVIENNEVFNIDIDDINLVAHSRGGGIAMIRASEDKRVNKLILWASLSEFDSFFRPETIQEWNANGVVYAPNKRTGQELPLKKAFYDDYLANKAKLDIQTAAKVLACPLLIIHGEQDETVNISHAEKIYELVKHSILIKVENAGHTFGASHPFDAEKDVTELLEELVENTIEFVLD